MTYRVQAKSNSLLERFAASFGKSISHEAILCKNRIKIVAEAAPSFKALVMQAILLAEET
jgi:hypothetical protein